MELFVSKVICVKIYYTLGKAPGPTKMVCWNWNVVFYFLQLHANQWIKLQFKYEKDLKPPTKMMIRWFVTTIDDSSSYSHAISGFYQAYTVIYTINHRISAIISLHRIHLSIFKCIATYPVHQVIDDIWFNWFILLIVVSQLSQHIRRSLHILYVVRYY